LSSEPSTVPNPEWAKLLGPQFNRLSDDAWAAGRPRNRPAGGEAAWRWPIATWRMPPSGQVG